MLTTKNKEVVLATRVTTDIQRNIERVSAVLGLKPSEYLRRLILDDFEERSITSDQIKRLKEELNATQEQRPRKEEERGDEPSQKSNNEKETSADE